MKLLKKKQVVKVWNVGGHLIRLNKRGRYAIVKYDGKVVFSNLKDNKSFNAFWKKIQNENKQHEWIPVSKKTRADKEPMYIAMKENFRNRINKLKIKKS